MVWGDAQGLQGYLLGVDETDLRPTVESTTQNK